MAKISMEKQSALKSLVYKISDIIQVAIGYLEKINGDESNPAITVLKEVVNVLDDLYEEIEGGE